MTTIHFDLALTPEGWRKDVSVTVANGLVTAVTQGRTEQSECHAIGLPGLPNLHSHAFQRGMAGLAETRGPGADSFWSWREIMYRFALSMTPDDVEAMAGQLYVEMLEAGFTRVGEFHYLHHDIDGRTYADPAEMAVRIAAASRRAGINLTLLPVFYHHAGFGGLPAQADQRRFLCDPDSYGVLHAASRRAVAGLDGANVGVAPHSLRAAGPEEVRALASLAGADPIHIHVAEQVREVEECIAWSGARPVEWLLDNVPVDGRWCLIHATHMTPEEARRLAVSGAVAGLCPITEANLGDGIVDAPAFLAHGGAFGVGSDSNVQIDAAAELRQLEYSQRLARRARNVLAEAGRSTGRMLFEGALAGGSKALGQGAFGIAPSAPADFVSLRADHPALAGHGPATLLDAWIFGAGRDLVDCVWTRGVKRVEGGRHTAREPARRAFAATMARLLA